MAETSSGASALGEPLGNFKVRRPVPGGPRQTLGKIPILILLPWIHMSYRDALRLVLKIKYQEKKINKNE